MCNKFATSITKETQFTELSKLLLYTRKVWYQHFNPIFLEIHDPFLPHTHTLIQLVIHYWTIVWKASSLLLHYIISQTCIILPIAFYDVFNNCRVYNRVENYTIYRVGFADFIKYWEIQLNSMCKRTFWTDILFLFLMFLMY